VFDGLLELGGRAQWARWRNEREARAGENWWWKSHRAQRRERFSVLQLSAAAPSSAPQRAQVLRA
jgi:hypothetical protein